jgi:hypothetical protein
MFRSLAFRWKLWRLERLHRKEMMGTERALQDAWNRSATRDELSEIEGGSSQGVMYWRIRVLTTQFLVSEAARLVVPLPSLEDKELWTHWGSGAPNEEHVLTIKGINELRAAIRVEQKARAERFLVWVPGVVGILGALIGLVSVLKK